MWSGEDMLRNRFPDAYVVGFVGVLVCISDGAVARLYATAVKRRQTPNKINRKIGILLKVSRYVAILARVLRPSFLRRVAHSCKDG